MLEDALLRVGRMRLGAQDLAGFGRHGEGEVGEQRAVEIIDQLLVGHIRVIGVSAFRPELALGVDHRLTDIAGVARVVGGIDPPGAGDVVERGGYRAAVEVLPGGRLMALHPHRIMTAWVHFEQRVGQAVVDEGREFRVDRRQVVALVEIVADQLPVELAIDREVEHPHPVRQAIAGQPFGEGGEPFVQRGNVIVHAPEHERTPGIAAQLGEVDFAAGIAIGEVVGILDMGERAVEIVLPAVIGASDARCRGDIAEDQPVAAMRAGIVERLDRTIVLADHDHRFLAEIVAHDVARFLEFGEHPAQMPDLGPEVVLFQLHPFLRDVAIRGDWIAAHRHVEFGRVARRRGLHSHFSTLSKSTSQRGQSRFWLKSSPRRPPRLVVGFAA